MQARDRQQVRQTRIPHLVAHLGRDTAAQTRGKGCRDPAGRSLDAVHDPSGNGCAGLFDAGFGPRNGTGRVGGPDIRGPLREPDGAQPLEPCLGKKSNPPGHDAPGGGASRARTAILSPGRTSRAVARRRIRTRSGVADGARPSTKTSPRITRGPREAGSTARIRPLTAADGIARSRTGADTAPVRTSAAPNPMEKASRATPATPVACRRPSKKATTPANASSQAIQACGSAGSAKYTPTPAPRKTGNHSAHRSRSSPSARQMGATTGNLGLAAADGVVYETMMSVIERPPPGPARQAEYRKKLYGDG
jgi:hypothetical protein